MLRWLVAVLHVACLLAGPATALQKNKDPDVCPWCRNDPVLMQAAGVVSHGPLEIGPHGSQAIVEDLPASQWVFIETAHLRWASSLGETSVDQKDKARVQAELDRLRAFLPDVPRKARKLDPWLRLHLFAARGEELYARFQRLLGVTDADFPETRQAQGPYMGNGRFLGEKDKFEVILHTTRANHYRFTEEFTGIRVTDSFRWHVPSVHKMLVSIPAQDADLRQDRWLFPHIAHNLSHLFLVAYKHFSYDPPIWLDEGLAHAIEKEIEPRSQTTDGEEGTLRDTDGPADWEQESWRLLRKKQLPTLAQLMHVKEFGDLTIDANVICWSMLRFLIDEHPEALAKFIGGVKGQLDEAGYPTGKDLLGLQRRLLQELWGWSPAEFDEHWAQWVRSQEAAKE